MNDDAQLLQRYARAGDDAAFAEVVRRRLGLVYAVALRRTGDADRAKDAAQAVFIRLARDAAKMAQHPAFVGGLYRSAYNAAMDIVRAEAARAAREREAHAMHEPNSEGSADTEQLRPLLDNAMLELDDADRDALLLRYYDQQAFAEIGRRLKLSENTARMRVQRALDKLRAVLERRGIVTTAGALAVAVEAHAATTVVPTGLATAIMGTVNAAGVVPAAVGVAFLTMKITYVTIGALVVMGGSAWLLMKRSTATIAESSGAPLATVTAAQSVASRPTASKSGLSPIPAREVSPLARGEKVLIVEMKDRGNATPREALETFVWAQEGGDIDRLAEMLHLTPSVRVEAEKFFAMVPPETQAVYRTPLRLVGAFFSGGGADVSSRPAKPSTQSYQVLSEEAGAKILVQDHVLGDEIAADPAYQTLRTQVLRANGTVVTTPVWIFHRTADGWRYVPPPSMIEGFGRLLKKGPTKAK